MWGDAVDSVIFVVSYVLNGKETPPLPIWHWRLDWAGGGFHSEDDQAISSAPPGFSEEPQGEFWGYPPSGFE